jgi:hypothetical protein
MFHDCFSMLFRGYAAGNHLPIRFFAFLAQASVGQVTLGGFLWLKSRHHGTFTSFALLEKT